MGSSMREKKNSNHNRSEVEKAGMETSHLSRK